MTFAKTARPTAACPRLEVTLKMSWGGAGGFIFIKDNFLILLCPFIVHADIVVVQLCTDIYPPHHPLTLGLGLQLCPQFLQRVPPRFEHANVVLICNPGFQHAHIKRLPVGVPVRTFERANELQRGHVTRVPQRYWPSLK